MNEKVNYDDIYTSTVNFFQRLENIFESKAKKIKLYEYNVRQEAKYADSIIQCLNAQKAQLKKNIRNEIREEIKNELREEIKNELREEIKNESKKGVFVICNAVREEIKNELREEIKNESKKGVFVMCNDY